MSFPDQYGRAQALGDLRRVADALAAKTDDDNAQGDAADLLQAADWFSQGAEVWEQAVEALAEAPEGSEWWYDGRDIFHNPTVPQGNHHLVIPLPETFHESQRVPDSVARLVVASVNYVIRCTRGGDSH